jgi:hypothetical protein
MATGSRKRWAMKKLDQHPSMKQRTSAIISEPQALGLWHTGLQWQLLANTLQ